MCARRFLIAIFMLTLLVVAGAFAIFQWGGNVLLRQATPQGHFEPAKAGSGPDYSRLDAWIARPEIRNNPSQWVPDNRIAFGIAYPPVSIFYIHPTTYLSTDRWNAPLHADAQTEFRTRLFVQSQGSALTSAGHVWAPRYRQAAYGAFLLKSDDARKALDFAYADVAAAFAEFLKQAPKDRAIILAGHSQGALHLMRLLKEKVAGQPVAKRVAAAYVVGWPISTTADLPALGLPACRSADQAGCILSWMSFGDPANPGMMFDEWKKTTGPTGAKRRQEDVLCVNPLTGTRDGAAPPQENPGTLIPAADLKSATLSSGLVGARCHDGLLLLDGAIPAFSPPPILGNNFHVYDYALFWAAIREDAERRSRAWQRH